MATGEERGSLHRRPELAEFAIHDPMRTVNKRWANRVGAIKLGPIFRVAREWARNRAYALGEIAASVESAVCCFHTPSVNPPCALRNPL